MTVDGVVQYWQTKQMKTAPSTGKGGKEINQEYLGQLMQRPPQKFAIPYAHIRELSNFHLTGPHLNTGKIYAALLKHPDFKCLLPDKETSGVGQFAAMLANSASGGGLAHGL